MAGLMAECANAQVLFVSTKAGKHIEVGLHVAAFKIQEVIMGPEFSYY
jgi:hypothetical protein